MNRSLKRFVALLVGVCLACPGTAVQGQASSSTLDFGPETLDAPDFNAQALSLPSATSASNPGPTSRLDVQAAERLLPAAPDSTEVRIKEIAEARELTEQDLQSIERFVLNDSVQKLLLDSDNKHSLSEQIRERIKILREVWPDFSAFWRDQQQTKEVPIGELWRVYIPLAQWVLAQKRAYLPKDLYLAGIYGSPGQGKTTLAQSLVIILNHLLSPEEGEAIASSMDDYFKSKVEREALRALGYTVGYKITNRGPAGTHDTGWLHRTIVELANSHAESEIHLPQFDKLTDDRSATSRVVRGKVGIWILEGITVGANTHFDLQKIPLGLQRQVAIALQQEYRPIFQRLDALIAFESPPLEQIEQNREEQEQLLKRRTGQRALSRAAIERLVRYYICAVRHPDFIPRQDDLNFLAYTDAQHRIVELVPGHRSPPAAGREKQEPDAKAASAPAARALGSGA